MENKEPTGKKTPTGTITLNKEQYKEYIETLNNKFNIPEGHRLIGVFKNNNDDTLLGYLVVEKGKEADYPVLSLEQVFDKYGFREQ